MSDQAIERVADAKVRIQTALGTMPDASVGEAMARLAQLDPYIWSMLHRRLKQRPLLYDISQEIRVMQQRNMPLTTALLLRHRPFLVQPLLDTSKHKVYKKARQVGVSELGLNEILWFLSSHPDTKWVLTFPRDTQLKDFSTTRITEALEETPAIKRLVGSPNQTYTKRIGNSYMILRSAWEGGLGEGVDADGVTFDEKDRMKENVEQAFEESLSSSPYGLVREVSTPSLPGRGVDISYAKSCQYQWHVRCTRCNLSETVAYPDNFLQLKDVPLGATQIDKGSYKYACKRTQCRGDLDKLRGQWVAAYPNKVSHIAGYHMPQTIVPWISCDEVMAKKIKYRLLQPWQNYVLAETSLGDKIFCQESDIIKCIAGHKFYRKRGEEWSRVTVGIDWGTLNWVTVWGENSHNDRLYIIGFAVYQDSDTDMTAVPSQVHNFIQPFEPDLIVADAGYGRDRNAYLSKRWGDSFYACYYNPSDKHSRSFAPQFVQASHRVLCDRTVAIKAVMQLFKDCQIGLPAVPEFITLLTQHLKNLVPLTVEEDGEIYETIEKKGDDHIAHACAYAYMAMEELRGQCQDIEVYW